MTAITLITDFGLQDGHVGAMKGVMRSIAFNAEIFDISHEIPPQNIRHAGFVLMTAYAYWPTDTIHVIVVDPGVGTGRRAIAVRTGVGTFVAPDNGVLSHVLAREEARSVVALTNAAYWHHPVSPSFHGRDIFGPAAAHLACGVPLGELGERVAPESLITISVLAPHRHLDGHITAHVQHIDRFGNCTTDVPGEWLQAAAHWRFEAGRETVDRVGSTFGDVAEGELVAMVDSTGYVAIALRNGNAADRLQLGVNAPIQVWPVPGG